MSILEKFGSMNGIKQGIIMAIALLLVVGALSVMPVSATATTTQSQLQQLSTGLRINNVQGLMAPQPSSQLQQAVQSTQSQQKLSTGLRINNVPSRQGLKAPQPSPQLQQAGMNMLQAN